MAITPEMDPRCPKCHRAVSAMAFEDTPQDWMRLCQREEPSCRFVACDLLGCAALHDPSGLLEVRTAMIHWRDHPNHGGCSHGR